MQVPFKTDCICLPAWCNIMSGCSHRSWEGASVHSTCLAVTTQTKPTASSVGRPPWVFVHRTALWRNKGQLETFSRILLVCVLSETLQRNCVWTIHEPHLSRARRYTKSPTAQDTFRPIPGLISCAGLGWPGWQSYLPILGQKFWLVTMFMPWRPVFFEHISQINTLPQMPHP